MASHSPKRNCSIEKSKPSKESKEAHMNAINNNVLRVSPRRQACLFAEWFRKLVDSDRSSLCLYLADDATLQWFGRTIKTKKKISGFLKYDMHCTSHRFTSVEVCGPISIRGETEVDILEKKSIGGNATLEVLATPLNSETPTGILNACLNRVSLRSLSVKRARAPSSSPDSPLAVCCNAKKSKITQSPGDNNTVDMELMNNSVKPCARSLFLKSDSNVLKTNGESRKNGESITILEEGQGDCLPSTSGTDPRKKRASEKNDDFFSQLPHSYVEARCVIEFTKTRVKRGADILKWERQCKLQVAYTEDPVYAGEYIIWTVVYSDNNKCRRNLLAAFEAVSKECESGL